MTDRKLLPREPSEEAKAAIAKALVNVTDNWLTRIYAAIYDSLPPMPEAEEVERRLRVAAQALAEK